MHANCKLQILPLIILLQRISSNFFPSVSKQASVVTTTTTTKKSTTTKRSSDVNK